jgi:hypothetical protein
MDRANAAGASGNWPNNSLAADDHQLVLIGDTPCGADQVFKVGTLRTPVPARRNSLR